LGFQVITCPDSSTFFKKVESLYKKNKNVGFFLIDYILSEDINGKELLKRLKRKYPDKDIKSIVFSGYVDNDYMNNYRRYGFIGAIEKPFTYFSMKKKLKEIFTANNVENVRNL